MPEYAADEEWATIGHVVALFGVRGELKVRLMTDIPNRFAQLAAVYIGSNHIRYTIKQVRPYKGEMIVLGLEGVEDASAAETLRNLDICIPLSQLAELPPDSYYQHDILGLRVSTLSGHDLGEIVEIIETGSNDVYVIKAAGGGGHILIPAIKQVVKEIDLIRRAMYIDPLPGLLDNSSSSEREEEALPESEAEQE